jgi:Zn-dependent protease with chaperone function
MDVVDAARELIPYPVRYGNTVIFPLVATLGAVLVIGLAYRLARPRVSPDSHWTVRASDQYSGTRLILSAMMGSLAAGICVSPWFAGPVGQVDRIGMMSIVAFANWLVATLFFCAHRLRSPTWLDRTRLRRGLIGEWLLTKFSYFPVFLATALMPADPGPALFVVLGLGVAFLVWDEMGGGIRIARRVGLARPASDRICGIVDCVAADVGRAPPSLFIAEMGTANALAYPLIDTMGFTERTVEAFTDEEIAGIAAHEISHLDEPRMDTAKRLLKLPLLLVIMVSRPALANGLVLPYVLAVAATLYFWSWTRRAARRLEESADQDAQDRESGSATVYATALEKLHRENLVPAVLREKLLTHPELYDRLEAAGVTPDYPRPSPPATRTGGLRLVIVAAVAVFACLLAGHWFLVGSASDDEDATLTAIAVTGGDETLLYDLSCHWLEAGRREDAVTLLLAAEAVAPDDPVCSILLAETQLVLGRTEEARQALDRALLKIFEQKEVEPWVLEFFDSTESRLLAEEAD